MGSKQHAPSEPCWRTLLIGPLLAISAILITCVRTVTAELLIIVPHHSVQIALIVLSNIFVGGIKENKRVIKNVDYCCGMHRWILVLYVHKYKERKHLEEIVEAAEFMRSTLYCIDLLARISTLLCYIVV
uniref:uncharacterized protein LOC105349692 n=1 Tax=Fragaria vesca subsp. vesca TaxID=101020 RepID=UPI0005C99F27|nr:PREDICTED: uncharacterized protein LOC105349692 [Fragaria vesca subsp. vesca]XP_011458345.1 PREDICTED: uncharacterized protein LOC105349692 [Fragaria vesca subsp. vesca]XP_011458346.1 PREDICTED: uncharacterized protein LOC105349692 [Fragaria vesca subsp. vesca]XP_011458347.1 PREDICTED: uncharacterized protein LOC105349692 [Fragaria vesca subsp. vesca]